MPGILLGVHDKVVLMVVNIVVAAERQAVMYAAQCPFAAIRWRWSSWRPGMVREEEEAGRARKLLKVDDSLRRKESLARHAPMSR
jgi:hypothetical protein